MVKRLRGLHPGAAAVVEVCILFLPAIPAYLWMWPNLEGAPLDVADLLTHLYILAGTLFISLRRWNAGQLGLNRKGLWPSLIFGAAILLGRTLSILSVDWGRPAPVLTPAQLVGDFIYYIAVVGFVQEFLFRGLLYRAFADWLGTTWAIWGTTIGFVLFHIFGWGPLHGLGMLLYGLIFGLLRWRAGGIWGLVLIHGAMDFFAAIMLPDLDVTGLGQPQLPYPALGFLGFALLLLVPLVLWKFYPSKRDT